MFIFIMFREGVFLIILFCLLCIVERSVLGGVVIPQTEDREELTSDENQNCLSIVSNSESGSAGEMQICLPSKVENDTDASEDHPVKGVIVWGNKVSEFVSGAQKMLSVEESKMDEDKNNTPIIEDEIRYDFFKFDEYMRLNFYLHELKNWKGYGTKCLLLVSSVISEQTVLITSLIDSKLKCNCALKKENLLKRTCDCNYDLRAEFTSALNKKYHLPVLYSLMEDNLISGYKKDEWSPEPVYLLMCRLGYDIYGINDVEAAARQPLIKSVRH